jgi:predicted nucleic-acid-binding protein
MIGLDTNVIVHYLLADDPEQFTKASKLINSLTPEEKGYINLLVVAEMVWVLRSIYKISDTNIADRLLTLATSNVIEVQNGSEIQDALSGYEGKPGIIDTLIPTINKAKGCAATKTFDVKTSKQTPMQLL